MSNNFKFRIDTLVEEIKNNERIELLLYEFKEPLSTSKIDEKEEEYSLSLSREIREFYGSCGGIKLKWKGKNLEGHSGLRDKNAEGSINILDVNTMIMAFDGRHWLNELWSEKMNDELKTFKKRLKIFDYFGSDNVDAVCVEMKNGVLTPKLWVNNLDYGVFPLELDLSAYINLSIQTKGIWGWQFFYAQMTWVNANHGIRNNAEHILEIYPILFGNDSVFEELRKAFIDKTRK